MLTMIYACDVDGAIGKDGDLPWRQSTDLQHFKQITIGGTIVMGRKTWESLPGKLPNRTHLVMTRGSRDDVDTITFPEVLKLSKEQEIFIIGGGEIYNLFLEHAKEVHRTIIHTVVENADTFAPEIEAVGFYLMTERTLPAGERDDHAMTFQHWIV